MGRDKKTQQQEDYEISGQPRPPACFVFRLGRTSQSIKNLKRDFRIAFLPNTAQRLKERRTNTLRDFLALAGPLGVTHFLSFTQSLKGVGNPYLRIAKTPKGPTLTFKIKSFATMRDVIKLQRRPHQISLKDKESSPLVVLNNFSGAEEHLKLTSVMLQNLFPPLNVREVNLRQCRRVVLFNFNKQTNEVEFRHYVISIRPSSTSTPRRINKIMKGKIPKLGNYKDISDYVLGEPSGYSDSEVDDPSIDTEAIFPTKKQRYKKKNQDTGIQQTAVRLHEVGPRINMELIKIQSDLFSGKVLYHRYIEKTQKEIEELDRKHAEKNKLKRERKLQQEKNVEKKKNKKQGGEQEEDDDDELFQDNEDFRDNHSDDEQDDVLNEFDDDDLDNLHDEQEEEEEKEETSNNNNKKASKKAEPKPSKKSETKPSKKSETKSSKKRKQSDSSDDEEDDE